jgi:hypothetical protein
MSAMVCAARSLYALQSQCVRQNNCVSHAPSYRMRPYTALVLFASALGTCFRRSLLTFISLGCIVDPAPLLAIVVQSDDTQ